MTTHAPRELQDLLAASVVFPYLGMVKFEAEHSVPGLDQLRINLDKRRSTRSDVSASVEGEYVKEIDLATFIQSMLVVPALEPKAVISLGPATRECPAVEAISTPQATAADKIKYIYVPLPKRIPLMRPRRIVIRTRATTTPMAEEEKDEVIPGGIDLAPQATNITLASLSEEEQSELIVKASTNTVREEQVGRVASFIYDRPPGILRFFMSFFLCCGVAFLSSVALMFVLLSTLQQEYCPVRLG